MIENGVDVNASDNFRNTPLSEALVFEELDIAWLLLNNGADSKQPFRRGDTVLHLAARKGYTELARDMILEGANVNARNGEEFTPLHNAAWNGHKEIVELLIQNGSDYKGSDYINKGVGRYSTLPNRN